MLANAISLNCFFFFLCWFGCKDKQASAKVCGKENIRSNGRARFYADNNKNKKTIDGISTERMSKKKPATTQQNQRHTQQYNSLFRSLISETRKHRGKKRGNRIRIITQNNLDRLKRNNNV